MVLSGAELSKKIKESTKEEISALKAEGITPALRCVVSSADRSTDVYLNSIKKNCEKLGIDFAKVVTDGEHIIEDVKKLNDDKKISGIMIMHPVPQGVNEIAVLESLNPLKDVEGRTPQNLGKVLLGVESFTPCTAQAVMELLDYYKVDLKGANVTIVGRSTTVGKPLSLMMLSKDATVTVCHSKTRDLKEKTKNADVLIAAVGKAKMFDAEWVKEGAVVIDVGINVVNGKVVGDVDFESVSQKASVSKVPGGVGSVTSAILMRNVVKAAQLNNQ
ncbi:bifunctional 5,10-methylenetetrahydrofolate dehydrogenase/5,10-methenyltetrahydrofolate cyclohydrolase [Mesoaciditoga lauensis]|uniref:bifunctional 5,10-methylenetetrahydrofolate dehydrogenase/5,10-methenyltetrahydrofolate cyclohydrolase n=1 Tax=Mesoaciditoga lauensis TaxID=1495039 RepID=UPI00068E9446|nr:bifunctional 5,10-methylenetetrahydrofolate dehydrogenase/5,10-methenyltetrahydrofolate cyclohydrolase [Mesoaciditoga lauensis]